MKRTLFIASTISLLFALNACDTDLAEPKPTPDPEKSATITIRTNPATPDAYEHKFVLEVKDDETVLSLLQRAGKENNIVVSITSGYVSAIDGLAQFDRGETSGWIGAVNGEALTVGADKTKIEAGDTIEWLYSYDWGTDWGYGWD